MAIDRDWMPSCCCVWSACNLVDADMNKESTRLQALQVQQQLGIQALSIANGNSQSILALFKNG